MLPKYSTLELPALIFYCVEMFCVWFVNLIENLSVRPRNHSLQVYKDKSYVSSKH